jgi:tetratricopeptide (TPR) repeat protein
MSTAQIAQLLDQAQSASEQHDYAEAVRLHDLVIDQTKGVSSAPVIREMRLAALKENGRLHRLLGNQQEALACYEQYYLDVGSGEQAVDALSLLANQYNSMGRYEEALKASREALELTSALNYTVGRATAFQNMGRSYAHLGRSEESEGSLRKALALFEQVDDNQEVARTCNWLGITMLDQGRMDKGISAFQQALMLSEFMSDVQKASVLSNLGECHQRLYDTEQALSYHRQALELAHRTQFRSLEADVSRNLGVDLWHLGELEECLDILHSALVLSEETGQQDIKLQSLEALAEVNLDCGQPDKALVYAEQLQNEAEAIKARHYQARGLFELGLCYQHMGEAVKAEQMWHQALFLAHETNQQGLLWRIHAKLAQAVTVPALAETHDRIAAEVIDQIIYPIEDKKLRETFLNAPQVKAVLDANRAS